jgi:hypothetical protein
MIRHNAEEFHQRVVGYPLNESQLYIATRDIPINPSPDGPWICGGAVRKTIQKVELDSDLDVFFKTQDQRDDVFNKLLKHNPRVEHQHHKESGLAVTNLYFSKKTPFYDWITIGGPKSSEFKVQLISYGFFDTIEKVLDSFDFTIAQFGYDGKDFVTGPYSLFDLGRMRLAVHKVTYPVSNMRRLLKYTSQGFYACNGCLGELALGIHKLDNINLDMVYVD